MGAGPSNEQKTANLSDLKTENALLCCDAVLDCLNSTGSTYILNILTCGFSFVELRENELDNGGVFTVAVTLNHDIPLSPKELAFFVQKFIEINEKLKDKSEKMMAFGDEIQKSAHGHLLIQIVRDCIFIADMIQWYASRMTVQLCAVGTGVIIAEMIGMLAAQNCINLEIVGLEIGDGFEFSGEWQKLQIQSWQCNPALSINHFEKGSRKVVSVLKDQLSKQIGHQMLTRRITLIETPEFELSSSFLELIMSEATTVCVIHIEGKLVGTMAKIEIAGAKISERLSCFKFTVHRNSMNSVQLFSSCENTELMKIDSLEELNFPFPSGNESLHMKVRISTGSSMSYLCGNLLFRALKREMLFMMDTNSRDCLPENFTTPFARDFQSFSKVEEEILKLRIGIQSILSADVMDEKEAISLQQSLQRLQRLVDYPIPQQEFVKYAFSEGVMGTGKWALSSFIFPFTLGAAWANERQGISGVASGAMGFFVGLIGSPLILVHNVITNIESVGSVVSGFDLSRQFLAIEPEHFENLEGLNSGTVLALSHDSKRIMASSFAKLTGMKLEHLQTERQCFEELKRRVKIIEEIDEKRFVISFVGDVDQGKSLLQNLMFGLNLNTGLDQSTVRLGVNRVKFDDLPCEILSLDTPGFPEFKQAAELPMEFLDCSNLVFIMIPYISFESDEKLRFVLRSIRTCLFMNMEFVILLTRFDECYVECKNSGTLESHRERKANFLLRYIEEKDPSLRMVLSCKGINLFSKLHASSCTNRMGYNESEQATVYDSKVQELIWKYGSLSPENLRDFVRSCIQAKLNEANRLEVSNDDKEDLTIDA
jgi:hypothetical protein